MNFLWGTPPEPPEKHILVYTDVEADDVAALRLLYVMKPAGCMVHVVCCLGNPERKAEIVRILFGDEFEVYTGIGGVKGDTLYEGNNILSAEQCRLFASEEVDATRKPAQYPLKKFEFAKNKVIDAVVLLTTPEPFMIDYENMGLQIDKVFIMGGFYHSPGFVPSLEQTRVNLSFNWKISDPDVLKRFLELMDYRKSAVLFSSQYFANEWNGNFDKKNNERMFGCDFITAILEADNALQAMVINWNRYATHDGTKKSMVDRIGMENLGSEFAPADFITTLGVLSVLGYRSILQKTQRVQFVKKDDSWEIRTGSEASGIEYVEETNLQTVKELITNFLNAMVRSKKGCILSREKKTQMMEDLRTLANYTLECSNGEQNPCSNNSNSD